MAQDCRLAAANITLCCKALISGGLFHQALALTRLRMLSETLWASHHTYRKPQPLRIQLPSRSILKEPTAWAVVRDGSLPAFSIALLMTILQ